MHSFILKRQPKSYNSWQSTTATKKESYKTAIETSFRRFYPVHTRLSEELYGVMYYFYKKNINSDADNLSKPLWDCLTGFLFTDDKQIKLRIAGSFDLTNNDFNLLNFTGIPGDVVADLLDAFDTEDHFVYIEVGCLNHTMFRFNIEANGN